MSSDPPRVCAVVLTHNRADILETCLEKIVGQTRPPDDVLVVDNASSDRTPELLAARPGVRTLRLGENAGGAGGFAIGLEEALGWRAHEWYWVLDDDSWAEPGCLEALLAGIERAPRAPDLMTSAVRWTDGSLHPMNRPWLRINRRPEFAEAAGHGLVLVRGATSVSTLVRREALDRHGFHPAHYVIWIDDIEWTGKILRDGVGYLVPESVCIHATPKPGNAVTDSRDRFYFKVRNQLWTLRSGRSFGGAERFFYGVSWAKAIVTYLRHGNDSRRAALAVVAKGLRDGLRREPR